MVGGLVNTGHLEKIRTKPNLLTFGSDPIITALEEAITINKIIERNNLTFSRPFIVLVNGVAFGRSEWDNNLRPGDTVRFVELPRGGGGSNPLRIMALVAVMALSFWLAGPSFWLAGIVGKTAAAIIGGVVGLGGTMLVNYFLGTGMPSSSSPAVEDVTTYALSTSNQLAVNCPVPEHFGRRKFFPPLAQAMYTFNVQNGAFQGEKYNHHYDQYLYALFIIGVGEYDTIDDTTIFIENTPLCDYDDSEYIAYNVVAPGERPSMVTTLSATNSAGPYTYTRPHTHIAYVSNEVSGQELSDEWVVFTANPPGAIINTVFFDITFPQGLGEWKKDGGDVGKTVSVIAQVRGINQNHTQTHGWTAAFSHAFYGQTTHTISMTCGFAVPFYAYQYEVRFKRSPAKKDNPPAMLIETCQITFMYARGERHPVYGDVTMLELCIRASERLSGNVASRIRVDTTRKLYPVTATGFGGTKVATSCIADAMAYIVTADNGGMQASTIVDWATLYALKNTWANTGYEFNYRFTSRCSVMEALSKCALHGRAVPYMPGGLLSCVRDELQTTSAQIYSDDDISEGSLLIEHKLRTADDPTCVEIQYTDPYTWETKSIYCYDDDGSELNPCTINLEGCISRNHAWRIGMYMYMDDKLNRTTVEFTTGLKGHIPTLGEKLLVASRVIDWAYSGIVIKKTGPILQLSEPVDFEESSTGQIFFPTLTGGASGPHTCTPGADRSFIVGEWEDIDIKTMDEHGEEASKFIFGPAITNFLPIRLLRVLPQNENEIRIVGSIINDEVYVDPGDPGDPGDPPDEPGISYDLIASLSLEYKETIVDVIWWTVTWFGSAEMVRIELKEGNGEYDILVDEYTAHTLDFESNATSFVVKITPYDEDEVLSPGDAKTIRGRALPAITNFQLDDHYVDYDPINDNYSDTVFEFSWDAVSTIDQYYLYFYIDDDFICSLVKLTDITDGTVEFTTSAATLNRQSGWQLDHSVIPRAYYWGEFTVILTGHATINVDSPIVTLTPTVPTIPTTLVVDIDAPDAPTDVVCIDLLNRSGTNDGFTLAWTRTYNVSKYFIYYHTTDPDFNPNNGEGTLCAIIETSSLSLLDRSVVHSFYIVGFDAQDTPWTYHFRVAGTNNATSNDAALNWSDRCTVTHLILNLL